MTDLEIFHNAPEGATPAELAAYLDEACGGDAELLTRVEVLFERREKDPTDDFLEDPPIPETATSAVRLAAAEAITEKAGDVVGPYTLKKILGEGGFGVVWLAEQSEPISREVALKVIKAGMDTREVLSRFEAERQALAMMDHPNIARVIDAGATEGGRPYFAMELVRGIPITHFCDAQRLDTRQRLELFRDVCSAVNHAHQKGIIHRDIKPSNVMVTGDEAEAAGVKVIDFGVAKATQGKLTEKTLVTRIEQFLGTPAYMSPEQAAMSGIDIDTRSDIYSLGVLLYELLAGAPPFDPKTLISAGYDEMRRIIREEEPPRPSLKVSTVAGEERKRIETSHGSNPQKLGRLLMRDLDWIVMKAIEKDRSRRYETASAFSADIRRYIADDPVIAAAPSAAYKFRKFGRRNTAAIAVVAAIIIVLTLATVVSLSLAARAIKAEQRLEILLEESEVAREAAESATTEAEAVSAFLLDIFRNPNPNRGGRNITVAETLASAVEKINTDLEDQPELQSKLRATLGRTYNSIGLFREAIPLLELARDYYLETHGPENRETLMAMNFLAISFSNSGREEEALELREEVVKFRRKVLGPEHRATLNALSGLARSYYDLGRREEAATTGEEMLGLRRKISGPDSPETLRELEFMAQVYHSAGQKQKALTLREGILESQSKINGPEHRGTISAMSSLAKSYATFGRHDDALKLGEEVLKLRKKLGSKHPRTLSAIRSLADSHANIGQLREALTMGEKLVEESREILGVDHQETLWAMHDLAKYYKKNGEFQKALTMREEVLKLRRETLGPEHPDTIASMHPLAFSYSDVGRREEGLAIRVELLRLRRKLLGPEHFKTLETMAKLADAYEDAGMKEKAELLRNELNRIETKAAK